MCTILKTDIVVATTFRDRYEFRKPFFNEGEEKNLINSIRVSLSDCMDKQARCENSAIGNVFARSIEADFYDYFFSNKHFFYCDADGNYKLDAEAVEMECGCLDLNVFFKKILENSVYSKTVLRAFNFL